MSYDKLQTTFYGWSENIKTISSFKCTFNIKIFAPKQFPQKNFVYFKYELFIHTSEKKNHNNTQFKGKFMSKRKKN